MILFFGAAGSGKSDQAKKMVDNEGWFWISTGQLLRDTTDPEVHELQQKGALVPIEKVNQVLAEALDKKAPAEKLVLDGYPRQIDQANWLVENCASRNIKIKMAFNFNVDMKELLKRMDLRGRSDDTPESINERLAIYHKEIDPILEFLSDKGVKVVHVDGNGTREDVHNRVMAEFENFKLI
jgi:adenylate kinase